MSKLGKILRIVGIVLMGLTAVLHLLGGIGTTCVAFGAEKYESMAGIVPYKWLYQLLVILTIVIAIAGIRATIVLVRGRKKSYRDAIIALVVGLVIAGVHMFASERLRGASAPTNVRVYANAITLALFLLFGLPKIREMVDFTRTSGSGAAGTAPGLAAMVMGLTVLTTHVWAAPTHTFGGINYADVWHTQLTIAGYGLTLLGAILSLRPSVRQSNAVMRDGVIQYCVKE